ncbi:MAG: acetyl-CoA C-acyltransferase [Planctomycetota bacterium]|nr:MAG: acetyl-CoA C-acyltransferase [Planctomycetota bacterium]
MRDVVICAGARTPMAEYSGTPGHGLFKDLSAIELGAIAAKAALERAGVNPRRIDHVVVGNALQTSADAIYGARHVGLKAGVPIETPALTVNRLCGSGIESVAQAMRMIQLREADVVLAGGMENMSQAPHVVRGGRTGFRFGVPVPFEDLLFEALKDPHCGLFMAQTAQRLAEKYGISREEQDDFAWRSMERGLAATEAGTFQEEIVQVDVKQGRKEIRVSRDDHVKPDSSREKLGKLRPAFGPESTVTAGNASGIVDGAAALVVAGADVAEAEGLPVLATIEGVSTVGVDPSIMGIGPAPAIRDLCKKTGHSLEQVDLFEINEAFAAQYLAVEKELGLDREKVNVNGGAIAIGHPLGATGTRLILTLALELRRRKGGFGIASACIGGGQGIALGLSVAGS